MSTNANDPVFPDPMRGAVASHHNQAPDLEPLGLTKREHFAAMVLQGLSSNSNTDTVETVLKTLGLPKDTVYDWKTHWPAFLAKQSIMLADALILALNPLPTSLT